MESDSDWVNKPYYYAFSTVAPCTTLSANHFYNVRNAAALSGDKTIVADNLVENFGNDGFDITASDLTIRHNVIQSGHHSPTELLHADGIQGWSLKGATNRNVRIEGNVVTDLDQSDDNYMQGISIFDGEWDGLEITNNVVITNTWHGIALYGVDNAKLFNNTVLPSRPEKFMTWITVRPAKDKRPSSNVVVRNNIAGRFAVGGVNVEVDHNLALREVARLRIPNADPATIAATLSFNLDNVALNSLVKNFDMTHKSYDLHPGAHSPAAGSGSAEGRRLSISTGRREKCRSI